MSNKKITTSKKVKFKGTETFINQTTGEIVEMQVTNIEERDANFHKIWLGHIIQSLDMIGNKKITVLSYILGNINRDNQLIATQSEIEKKLNISRKTINETFKMLINADFMKKEQIGVYRVNPNIVFKGGKGNRFNVLYRYQSIESNDLIEESD